MVGLQLGKEAVVAAIAAAGFLQVCVCVVRECGRVHTDTRGWVCVSVWNHH